jgi:hypothetical protein
MGALPFGWQMLTIMPVPPSGASVVAGTQLCPPPVGPQSSSDVHGSQQRLLTHTLPGFVHADGLQSASHA